MPVGTDGGYADAERHNERNGHRAGGDAAGVKRHRKETGRDKKSDGKDEQIKDDQHAGQGDAEQHTQQCENQEYADADGDRRDQRDVGHAGHLLRKHLQIRLGNSNNKAKQEGQENDNSQFFAVSQTAADTLPHGAHGLFCALCKKHHADNQQHGAHQETEQNARRDRGDAEAQHQHDRNDREHGVQGFFQLFMEF